MRIAVDAMGGDNAPEQIVAGAIAAAACCEDLDLVLVGQEDKIRAVCTMPDNVEIVAASQVIENDDKPLLALRRKRDSSLAVALQMLKDGQADAVVSAGNTGTDGGASLLVAEFPGSPSPRWRRYCRPRTARGVGGGHGATMDPRPKTCINLPSWGICMRRLSLVWTGPGWACSTWGGAEKGNELAKQTYKLLSESPLNFVGNVEARDIMQEYATCSSVTVLWAMCR